VQDIINQPTSATEHSPTQGNFVLPSQELLKSTRLSTAAAADQTASIDSELRRAGDVQAELARAIALLQSMLARACVSVHS